MLVAKGLTTGEVSAHFEEIYGPLLSKDTISKITDRVLTEMADSATRPLEKIYAAVFIDAIYVKVRDGQVANRPFYAAIGVDLAGHKDVLGLWAQIGGGESAKFWQVLLELKNRGDEDAFFVVCDGKGLQDSVGAVLPAAVIADVCDPSDQKHVQVRLEEVLKPDGRRPPTHLPGTPREAAWAAFEEFEEKWAKPYPDRAAVAERLGVVRALPGLRRRDPHRALQQERDQVVERPLPSPSGDTSRPSRPR